MKNVFKLILSLMVVVTLSSAIPGVDGRIISINISTDVSNVVADGEAFATVTVVATDHTGNAVENAVIQPIHIASGINTDAILSDVDDSLSSEGIYTFTVKSNIVESVNIYVIANAVAVDGNNYEYTSSSLAINFIPVPLPNGVSCNGGEVAYITSVYDYDYAPYVEQYTPASYDRPVAADGEDDQLVDIAGVLTQYHGETVKLSCNANYATNLPAYKAAYNVPAEHTENGVAKRVYFEYSSQTLNAGSNTFVGTIHTLIGTLEAKKLDINVGIGDGSDTVLVNSLTNTYKNVYGALLASFPMSTDADTAIAEVQLRIMVGIPDRTFGKEDGTGEKNSHMFLYLPITSPITGKIWLNNNLGADYTNLNSPSFNLVQQANNKGDYHAYGSLFQWGGKSDGHELTKWTGNYYNSGKLVTASKYFSWGQNEHNGHFIMTCADWRANDDSSLWNSSETNPNNACPVGYRVPTAEEWKAEMEMSYNFTWANSNDAYNSALKLTVSGFRWGNTVTTHSGLWGYYWSSDTSYCRTSYALSIYPHEMKMYPWYRGFGFNVRCIKN